MGEFTRPCVPAIEDQGGYRDGTEWEGTIAPKSASLPGHTVEALGDNPDDFSERTALASLLARNLRASPNVHSESVKQLSSSLSGVVLEYFAQLAKIRGQGTPVRTVGNSDSIWWLRCPSGHLTDEFLWLHQRVGIEAAFLV